MRLAQPFQRGVSPPARWLTRLAFSLIEVLVVIALLSLIIIGLVAMFSQTQRAYRLGTTQVDVLEAGRAVTDMMTREFSQMSPSYADVTNCYITLHRVGLQDLPGSTHDRTNLLEELFFLTEENQRWNGIGYVVLDPATGLPNSGLGTLYRYETNAFYRQPLWQLFDAYTRSPVTNMTRLLDGVVHFTVRAFDTNGVWISQSLGTNISVSYNTGLLRDEPVLSTFRSNAVPASVEIELGILEERTAERIRSINNPALRAEFLRTNAVGKVHVFRWRVPVRNVDPIAYQ